MFKFTEGHRFSGIEIDLKVATLVAADIAKGWVPAYHFDILLPETETQVGHIDARIGYTDGLVKYGGHIGYGIYETFRGHHYAAKACQLLRPLFQMHGMDVIWISCNPDNWPSRKTCEYIGCELVEIVDLPEDNDMYQDGERQKCRYRWMVY